MEFSLLANITTVITKDPVEELSSCLTLPMIVKVFEECIHSLLDQLDHGHREICCTLLNQVLDHSTVSRIP